MRDTLPLVLTPVEAGDDLSDWVTRNGAEVDEGLAHAGAILFRGFGVATPDTFEPVAKLVCGELLADNGEHNPVFDGSSVQTPVFYPPEKHLLWHNENSFNAEWPLRIVFCCGQPAHSGGETPVVDSRQVYETLDPAIRQRFEERRIMYQRVYRNGLGLTWQQVFGTNNRAEAEQRCAASGLRYEWLEGDRLRTTCVRPAAVEHAGSGRMSWFNQAQHWHTACLDEQTRAALQELLSEDEMPRSCFYGDGSAIEDSVMTEILDVYRSLESVFPWQQGDVLTVDNVAVAHARNPFTGNRKLFVAMGGVGRYTDGV
jgi:alpha-ketoglutarate-dependent taurine dioxygenase